QAARRTTALNEQALRRIGADLHDGPCQALALALLRLESLREAFHARDGSPLEAEFGVIEAAVRDGLADVRAISAGLRLPELAPLRVAEVAERAELLGGTMYIESRPGHGTTVQLSWPLSDQRDSPELDGAGLVLAGAS